ncbi:MAG: autotransporter outer membrane beta-barrel domain-containing protein [Sphingosinicella sp.]
MSARDRFAKLMTRQRACTSLVALSAATFLFASPAQAQNACVSGLPLPPGVINCAPLGTPPGTPPTTATINVVASAVPLVVTLADGFVSNGPFNLGTLAGADITVISPGVSTVAGTTTGVVINSGRRINAQIDNVSTTADGAIAVLLTAVDSIIFDSDGLIRTLGANAPALVATGTTINADLNQVRTDGVNAAGVNLIALNGPITLRFDAIQTNGNLSRATILRGTGDVTLQGRLLSTQGTDGVAFDISTSAAACILLGIGGCDVTATLEEVTTNGFGGIGGLVAATGDTTINIGVLRTGGNQAAGLDLRGNAAACAILGAGACDTAFTVGNLTTAGNQSPGALVRAVGDINANVSVLRTSGSEAFGLDLRSDPAACAILGAGACDTSFTVGQLTTSGAGATGVLVRAAGDTTGNVGILRTQGNDAIGIDIASSPVACVLVGAGACDVGVIATEVDTQGNRAAAVLIDTIGRVTADIGLIRTDGNDSTGLGIVVNPAACLVLGPGSCRITARATDVETIGDDSPGVEVDGGEDPITVVTGDVDTRGNRSPGVDVTGTGTIDVTTGNVRTEGPNSPGIIVDGDDGRVGVTCTSVTTLGDRSPGIAISSEGDIVVRCGPITTRGADSDAVNIDGGFGTVDVNVGAIIASGPRSDGIEVATTTGNQIIVAGPISVTGPGGGDGIAATATGCANINITARDDILSATGVGIFASTPCRVDITTLAGADVNGAIAGIDVTSGTGAFITLGGDVRSSAGPAIDVDGAAATITVGATGSITGRIDLTDAADRLTNNGTFNATGTSTFGGGADLLINAGTVRGDGTAAINALETFDNRGLVSMIDGEVSDRFTLCGDYVGAPGSRVGIDVQAGTPGTPADRLIICGHASGSTGINLNLLGLPAIPNPTGVLVVDALTAVPGAFTLAGPTRSGFIDYSIRQAGGDFFLVALPNLLAPEPLVLGALGFDYWYQSADAWSASAIGRRDNLGSETPRGFSFWAQGYIGEDEQGETQSFDLLGAVRDTDFERETKRRGAQLGFDFAFGRAALGITGGYQHARTEFLSGTQVDLDGHNIGAYLLYGGPTGLFGELLAKADFFDGSFSNAAAFGAGRVEGNSYGAEGEIGYRLRTGGMEVEINGALAYVRTELDPMTISGFTFTFDEAESLRGRLGLRVSGTGNVRPYADVKVLHEFMGENDMTLTSGGFTSALTDTPRGTWFRGELGLTGNAGRAGGFAAAWAEAGDVEGYGIRLGFRW